LRNLLAELPVMILQILTIKFTLLKTILSKRDLLMKASNGLGEVFDPVPGSPLPGFSHILDWRMFGAQAPAYHIVICFFILGRRFFYFLFLVKATNNLYPSAFAAAFFALHP
jgi:hypothetical protein